MPEFNVFTNGFGLDIGHHDNIDITNVSGNEEATVRYYSYDYHIIVTAKGYYNDVWNYISNQVTQRHVLYGVRYPYDCWIDTIKQGDVIDLGNETYEFYLTGHSKRQ